MVKQKKSKPRRKSKARAKKPTNASSKPGPKIIEFDLAKVEQLAAQGLTQEETALALGVSARTVEYRLKDSADFADAYKKGQALGIQKVSNRLFKSAVKGNTIAGIFFLKARAKWTTRVEVTGKDGAPLNSALSPEQMMDQAKEMLEEARGGSGSKPGDPGKS